MPRLNDRGILCRGGKNGASREGEEWMLRWAKGLKGLEDLIFSSPECSTSSSLDLCICQYIKNPRKKKEEEEGGPEISLRGSTG